MRVLISCAELGLGHASRAVALGKQLEKREHELFFFSGGRAYQLLKREFKHVYSCTPVGWYENAHGILASASLLNILVPLPIFNYETNSFEIKSSSGMETIRRYYDLRSKMQEIKPDLIVSDGDLHVMRLADRWKIPSVYITNVVRPSYSFSPLLNPGERFTERYLIQCSKIIIPDNPPPFTVSQYNVGDLTQVGIGKKVEFVGSFFDSTPIRGSENHIFAPISGPPGTRARLTQMILPVLRKLAINSIVSLGVPGKKTTAELGNCEVHSWLSSQERQEYMKNSEMVIFSGGHITAFETIKYVKPSICVPTQPEQMGNAAKLQELGCSIVARSREQLKAAVQKIEQNKQSFKENMEKLNEFSSKFNGLERAIKIIESTTS
jgi:UDP-N-acetylglucosamine--N-acetylmuramyl-(pentapeptide) pyrophosphoryl-undecaprenol N-acetylglucosamine transferase